MGLIACFILLILVYAWMEGYFDARKAMAGVDIDHTLTLTRRVMVGFMIALTICTIGHWNWMTFIPQATLAAGLFSGVFRLTMNTRRDRNAFYVAPWSNNYDMIMFRMRLFFWYNRFVPDLLYMARNKKRYFEGEEKSIEVIHGAGVLAYWIETSTFIVSFGLLTWIVLRL